MDIQQKGRLWYVPCSPGISVVKTSVGDRAVGRMVKAMLASKPGSDAEADLVGDTFFSLFRQDATTVDEAQPIRAVNKTLLDWTLSTPEFQTAKGNAANNLPVSLASAGVLWSSLTSQDALKDALEAQKKAEDAEKEAEELEQNADDLDERSDELEQEGREDDSAAASKAAEDSRQEAQKLRQQAESHAQQAAGAVNSLKKNPLAQGMVKSAVHKAAEKGEEVASVMKGWGIEPGETTLEDATQIIQMVEGNDKTLAKLAELIGRLKGVASRTQEAVKAGYTGVIAEPTLTNDITKLFPTERAYLSRLAPPYLRAQYVSRLFAGGGLLGWKPKFEGKKKGSFVAMIDRSGSMSGDDLSTAKAIGLGIAKALKDDDSITERKYRMTYFQSAVDQDLQVSDEDSWRDHMAWAKVSDSGGTDFDQALMYAVKQIHELKAMGVNGADILFITDGQARVSPEVKKAVADLKDEIGTRMITILIGGWGMNELEDMSDLFIRTRNLTDDAESLVEQITASIVKADLG